MHEPGPSLRNFSWDDLDGLARLAARLQGMGRGSITTVAERMRRLYVRPGFHPERDCLIAWDGNGPVGYLFMMAEERIGRGILRGGVHPRHRRRGIGKLMVDAMAAHVRTLGFEVLHAEASPSANAAKLLLQSSGFSPVRTHRHLLRRSTELTGLAEPAGYGFRLLEPKDVPALTQLQNEAFTGSWGFCPNIDEELYYEIYQAPIGKPDGVVLLEREGLLAGYCWTHQEAYGEPGVINMVGVSRGAQGRGLGRAITAAGIDHLLGEGAPSVELTVDGENTSAVRLYRRLGFRHRGVTRWYELRLR